MPTPKCSKTIKNMPFQNFRFFEDFKSKSWNLPKIILPSKWNSYDPKPVLFGIHIFIIFILSIFWQILCRRETPYVIEFGLVQYMLTLRPFGRRQGSFISRSEIIIVMICGGRGDIWTIVVILVELWFCIFESLYCKNAPNRKIKM